MKNIKSLIPVAFLLVIFALNARDGCGFVPLLQFTLPEQMKHPFHCLLVPTDTASFGNGVTLEQYEDDIYGDMLSMEKPISDSELSYEVLTASSILNPSLSQSDNGSHSKLSLQPITLSKRKIRPEWWDPFLEQEIGDIDDDTENEKWVLDIRDIVELKRGNFLLTQMTTALIPLITHILNNNFTGRPIWSKKSAQDLQRELKKALLSKGLHVPPVVAQVISAIYLDRTHMSLKHYKQEDEIACIEYRKWISEQKKKAGAKGKDPLLAAKLEVSKVDSSLLHEHKI